MTGKRSVDQGRVEKRFGPWVAEQSFVTSTSRLPDFPTGHAAPLDGNARTASEAAPADGTKTQPGDPVSSAVPFHLVLAETLTAQQASQPQTPDTAAAPSAVVPKTPPPGLTTPLLAATIPGQKIAVQQPIPGGDAVPGLDRSNLKLAPLLLKARATANQSAGHLLQTLSGVNQGGGGDGINPRQVAGAAPSDPSAANSAATDLSITNPSLTNASVGNAPAARDETANPSVAEPVLTNPALTAVSRTLGASKAIFSSHDRSQPQPLPSTANAVATAPWEEAEPAGASASQWQPWAQTGNRSILVGDAGKDPAIEGGTAFALRLTPGAAGNQSNAAAPSIATQAAPSQIAPQPQGTNNVPPGDDPGQAAPSLDAFNLASGNSHGLLNKAAAAQPQAAASALIMPGGATPNAAVGGSPALAASHAAASNSPSAPAAAVSDIAADQPSAAAQPVRTVHLTLPGAEEQQVHLRLAEHSGTLSVSVRTTDPALTSGLQEHLPELGARLEAERYQTEIWLPKAGETSGGPSSQHSDQQGEQSGGRAFSQGNSSSSGGEGQRQQGRQQEQTPAWWRQLAALGISSASSPAPSSTQQAIPVTT